MGDMSRRETSGERPGIALGPLTKRRIIEGLEGPEPGVRVGWAQLPASKGRGFSLGLFTERGRFSQVALADGKGRVFAGDDPAMDTHDMQPRFLFGREDQLTLPEGPRIGRPLPMPGMPTRKVEALTGGIVGRDGSGRMIWLASWIKTNGRYTLEQMRADLPARLRIGLEYRDAIAIAFFATYMLPQRQGLLLGFGAGNIFRRLGREAPIGAIRRSVRDTLEARAHGLRASGLEDHFAELMHEAGALDETTGLEAVHGAEPLHLYTSSYSGCYFFAWNTQMAFGDALRALRIEGNLNRFAAVSAWLEHNARLGEEPIEDTVTRAEAARIDMTLLDNPALLAFKPDDRDAAEGFDPASDDGSHAAWSLVARARAEAARMSRRHPDPAGGRGTDSCGTSEWVCRQTMATLLRQLRLPFRFDVDFRMDLTRGDMALGFTAAGASLMPTNRYDDTTHRWRPLDEHERAAMSAAYNLKVGIMLAALGFGTDERIKRVSLHIDSIGLEEAVAEQDNAISEMMDEVLAAIERMRTGDIGGAGSKADPKDGDLHGDPRLRGAESEGMSEGFPATSGAGEEEPEESDDNLERQFEELMRGGQIDETVFSMPPSVEDGAVGDAGEAGLAGVVSGEADSIDSTAAVDPSHAPGGPLDALQHGPIVRPLVTVTFERDAFLHALNECGLTEPGDMYRRFGARMEVNGHGGLEPIDADFDLSNARFSPTGSQEEPELAARELDKPAADVLGATDVTDLSIQRADLLQRAVADFHRLAADQSKPSVAKAQEAMAIVRRIDDPELNDLAHEATSALIDGTDTPDFEFTIAGQIDAMRAKTRDMLFSGRMEQGLKFAGDELKRLDALFDAGDGVPRYFNSYAERVVYNRLFATPGERTVLIPDNLFYAHMELAEVLAQIKGARAALPHLNMLVKYAPAYPLSHMRLAIQLARDEDWDSARAACLNALRVCLDRDDAAFAYYRFAYAEWMQDRFDTAAAAYIMSDRIAPGQIGALETELRELIARADSQCVPVPDSVEAAAALLEERGLPVWPRTEVAGIVRDAARVTVDRGLFVPARTLSMAAARMDDTDTDGVDVVQAQFLRSLNA